jgi:RNA polymerase sigma-70 factor (ECF subfamily)
MAIRILQRARWLLTGEVGLGEEAFIHLYQQHLERVFNYVRYRLGPEEAEDITADIFARVWARRRGYDPSKGAPTTWLWAIARNIVIDRLRRRRPLQVELSSDMSAGGDPQADVEEAEEWRRVRLALEHLPAVDQEIIALRFGAGHTNRMIATLTGLSEANVAQRLRRALRNLRTDMQGDDVS